MVCVNHTGCQEHKTNEIQETSIQSMSH